MPEPNERIQLVLELISYIDDRLPVGSELREQAIQYIKDGQLADAAQCCHKLYQLGLHEGNTYVQGVASHLLGTVYLALGTRLADFDRAAEYFTRSAQLFHSFAGKRRQHNEGVVWLSVGLLHEEECRRNRERHGEAIQAYKDACILLEEIFDPVAPKAQDSLRRATRKMTDWLTAKKYAQAFAFTPPHAPRPSVQKGPASEPPAASGEKALQTTAAVDSEPEVSRRIGFPLYLGLSMLLVIMVPVAVALGAGIVMPSLLSDLIPFLFGYIIAVFLILCLAAIWVVGGWHYRIPLNQTAVIETRGRIWASDGPVHEWVIPIVEDLRAFISLEKRTTRIFIRESSTPDGFTLSARAKAEYIVKDGAVAWRCMSGRIRRFQVLGLTRPARVEETDKCIEAQIRELVKQVLFETAKDPALQETFWDKVKIRDLILKRLNEQSIHSGIEFSRLDIDVQVRKA